MGGRFPTAKLAKLANSCQFLTISYYFSSGQLWVVRKVSLQLTLSAQFFFQQYHSQVAIRMGQAPPSMLSGSYRITSAKPDKSGSDVSLRSRLARRLPLDRQGLRRRGAYGLSLHPSGTGHYDGIIDLRHHTQPLEQRGVLFASA